MAHKYLFYKESLHINILDYKESRIIHFHLNQVFVLNCLLLEHLQNINYGDSPLIKLSFKEIFTEIRSLEFE